MCQTPEVSNGLARRDWGALGVGCSWWAGGWFCLKPGFNHVTRQQGTSDLKSETWGAGQFHVSSCASNALTTGRRLNMLVVLAMVLKRAVCCTRPGSAGGVAASGSRDF